jgi:hypothetical protein
LDCLTVYGKALVSADGEDPDHAGMGGA